MTKTAEREAGTKPETSGPRGPGGDAARARARRQVDRLWRRGCEFLGTDLGAMTPEQLEAEIAGTVALTRRPFGVNLITLHPQLNELIDVCVRQRVGHVVLAGGLPNGAAVQRIKGGGARLLCFAPAVAIRGKPGRMGADAIGIEGMEAGGHIGPVSTGVLAQEILPHIRDVPVFVAGGIGRGEAIVSYLEMGAAGVQLGTRFVCAHESIAHPNFKRAFVRAGARDAVPSIQLDARFPVIPVRALANQGTQRFLDAQRSIVDRFNRGEVSQKDGQLEI